MNVDFYSTKRIPIELKEKYFASFRKSLEEENLIEGGPCKSFENKFAKYLETDYVIGVGNGFDALRIALLALGIGPGDRVAVPAHTFIATWYAVQSIGAIPVGIDVDLEGQINLDILENQSNLQCVIPVHMHGTHCDMKRLTRWASQNSVMVVEDCAQAAGLNIQGKQAGTWGDAGAFSFYPTKNLFAIGDGGAISTSNPKIHEVARSISRYGTELGNKYLHTRLGQNSRLDTIQAAFLEINLDFLDEWNDHRRKTAAIYNTALAQFRQNTSPFNSNIYHHYIIYVEKRDELKIALQENGVGTEVHYPNLAAAEVPCEGDLNFPIGQELSANGLSLPISPWQEDSETKFVIDQVLKLLRQ